MDFFEVYDHHYDRVRRFVLVTVKDDWVADDLVQETFIRAQKNLDGLRDPSKLSFWLFGIAHNLCMDYFRRLKSSGERELTDESGMEITGEAHMQKELERRQMGKCVQDQIDLLPESLRSVIILFDTMGFSHEEIAEVLGISVENAKVRLHRARKKLRSILEEKCTFEMDDRNVLTCEPCDKNK
ncbi:RNA polymerase sigma factor [Thermodesulfobacteriota bacterium]